MRSSCSCNRCNLPFIFIPCRAPLDEQNLRICLSFVDNLTYALFDHHIFEVSHHRLAFIEKHNEEDNRQIFSFLKINPYIAAAGISAGMACFSSPPRDSSLFPTRIEP